MADIPTPSKRQSNRPLHSCARCSDRKVKCDREHPCSACIKHGAECVYRSFPPPKRRPNRAQEKILNDKVKRYEAILRERGIDSQHSECTTDSSQLVDTPSSEATQIRSLQPSTPNPTSTKPELDRPITKTQLVHDQGRSQFLDNGPWSRVVEELHDPQDVLEEESDREIESGDDFDFALDISPRVDNEHPHPSTESINLLWLIFAENVDPLLKITHAPSLQGAIQRATANITGIPRGFEALMFAIYSLSVLSLTDSDCRQKFGQPRKMLLSRYVSATKAALSRARFMSTTSIVVLQALVLHIFCIRSFYEPRAVWTLTGVAIRIAEGMGVHQDGEAWGLPPFEVEIRRRLWWQLKMHDFRTAELSGLAKFQGLEVGANSPQAPADVNDDGIYPSMTSPPTSLTGGATDMIFCLLRRELAATHAENFRRHTGLQRLWSENSSADEIKAKDEGIKDIQEALETKFIRYCDPTQPLHLMTMILVRTGMNIGRFINHHPRRWEHEFRITESEKQLV